MLCSRCKKKQATVSLTLMVNGYRQELQLCEECARENDKAEGYDDDKLGFHDLLAGILSYSSAAELLKQEKKINDRCPQCGFMLKDFKVNGRLGCSKCYEVFADQMQDIIRRIHGNIQHTGKAPQRSRALYGQKLAKRKLQSDLNNAVRHEEFERAVELRDALSQIEKEMQDVGSFEEDPEDAK